MIQATHTGTTIESVTASVPLLRIEGMLFAGVVDPNGGVPRPDRSRPGLARPGWAWELKEADAERYLGA